MSRATVISRVPVRQRARAAVFVVGVVVVLGAASGARAQAAPSTQITWQAVGPIRIGQTPQRVRQILGTPNDIFDSPREYDYRAAHLEIDFVPYGDSGRGETSWRQQGNIPVWIIKATGGSYHTIKNIRIGTTEAAVKHRLGGRKYFKCYKQLECSLDTKSDNQAPRDRTLLFDIRHGKVAEIELSYEWPKLTFEARSLLSLGR